MIQHNLKVSLDTSYLFYACLPSQASLRSLRAGRKKGKRKNKNFTTATLVILIVLACERGKRNLKTGRK